MHVPANPARANRETIHAIGLELRLWLVSLVAYVAQLWGGRTARLWVQGELRYARRTARQYLFLLAFERIELPRARRRTHRPLNTRRGFRYARRNRKAVKHFLRGIDLSSLKAIRRALETADALAARLAARVRWPAVTGAWVAIRPPARDLVRQAQAHATEPADTS
jgi:hypothetical protein